MDGVLFPSHQLEARDHGQSRVIITLTNANIMARPKLLPHSFKKPHITGFDSPRVISLTIARLRTQLYKGMEIHHDKTRSYKCKNYPEIQQLTLKHIFECSSFTPTGLKLSLTPHMEALQEILYSQDSPALPAAVVGVFNRI
ncbi:hypothetical protein TNCV_4101081 [Trichonephila clavipes]|nr:hypothetical protein TNCV_4101081 [Trichonephila clavipes]